MATSPEVVLFDLGGVCVELRGVERMLEWTAGRMDEPELWRRWLGSPAVRAFETGRLNIDDFADRAVVEFELPVSAATFAGEYATWAHGAVPGIHDLLRSLAGEVRLACLSNLNSVHHPKIRDEMRLLDHFEMCFLSHLTGLIKPDRDAFEHAITELACPAERVLFLDDNRINVEAAEDVGLRAHRVTTTSEIHRVLDDHGLGLPERP